MSPVADRAAPARWLVLSAVAPPPGREALVVDALRRVGARSVERDGERVVARFPEPARPRALQSRVLAAMAAAAGVRTNPSDPIWDWERYDDWAAQRARATPARRVGRRWVVVAGVDGHDGHYGHDGYDGHDGHDGHDGYDGDGARPAERDRVIRISPGVAFGGAGHPTTRACLELMEARVRQGDRVLDVGAGSGVLAIAAALAGADVVLALEADALAAAEATRNVAANGVEARVEVRALRAAPSDIGPPGTCDGVVANLEAAHLLPLLPALAAARAPDGWLVVSGLVASERDAALGALGMPVQPMAPVSPCDPRGHEGAVGPKRATLEERRDRGWWSAAYGRP
jgi:ribosomal protein L11 methyltransferase